MNTQKTRQKGGLNRALHYLPGIAILRAFLFSCYTPQEFSRFQRLSSHQLLQHRTRTTVQPQPIII